MAVYIVTGKLGGGKTLVSVKKIKDYLENGAIVATNLDLNLHELIDPFDNTCRVIRIPDKPSIDDLHCIGSGNESYDEELNGVLVLDECGTWFNSRSWSDKARKPVNDWFLHARKLGWDVFLIIQDISLLDSQARQAIAEHTVFCKRTDRLAIPFFSTAYKMITGKKMKLPKVHLGRVVYGVSESDLLVDRWATYGTTLFAAYDTRQLFLDDYPHGPYSVLPPYHTHGRYMAKRNWRYIMRLTRIFWKRFKSPLALGSGMLIGSSMAVAAVFATQYDPASREANTVSADIVAQPQVFVADPVISKLERMHITSSWVIDEIFSYGLTFNRDPESKSTEPLAQNVLQTRTLEKMGYSITPQSNCSFVAERDGQSVAVYCF